jgi:hypothetical protein
MADSDHAPSAAEPPVPVEVECYAGAAADETPLRFRREGRVVEVVEVLDRWHQVEMQPEWPRADYFRVRDADQAEHLLKHDTESDRWFLIQRR